MNPLSIALNYIERGWSPVPIPFGEKGPTMDKWNELIITRDNASKYFNNSRQNIGVQLGPKSGGLCDIDLDCPEAVQLAPLFLPSTAAVFGRKTKARSHYLYYVDDPEPTSVINFDDIEMVKDEARIVELRLGGGGKGAQTVFPGSKHESGEAIAWDQDGEPSAATCAILKSAVTKIALAVIVARRWQKKSRHDAALRLGGFLARAGWDQDEIIRFIEAVAMVARDEEVADRRKAVLDAFDAHSRGDKTYGLPALKELFGDAVASRIASILGYREVDTDATLEMMNNKYCVVSSAGKVRVLTFEHDGHREVPAFYSASDFRLYYSNKFVPGKKEPVPLGVWWLKHKDRRQYEGVVFNPGEPKVIDGRLLNLWRGWGITPAEGDWSLRRHIFEVLAAENKEHCNYILKWTAWSLQNPGTQPEAALVFRSIKGTGKGLFGRALCQAFGQHGLQISSHSHLTGNFNRHLQDCAMLFADEAFWPGDKSAEGQLKRIVTEPTLFIEPKGVDGRSEPNRLHVILAANAEWVVPASMRERRFAVFATSEKYIGKKAYFVPLYKQLENGGIAAMMYDLLALELGDWHPRNDIPNTEALIEQQRHSLNDKDQWWASLLTEGALPGAQQENLRRSSSFSLFEKARSSSPRLKYISDHELGHYLISRGCHRVRVKGGPRGWEFPPLAEVRAEWAKTFPTDWDDPERGLGAGTVLGRLRPFDLNKRRGRKACRV